MSDAPGSNEIVQVANEYRRLNRLLEAKTQQLEALLADNGEAGDFPASDFAGAHNRRYSIDFPFLPRGTGAEAIVPRGEQMQERSVTVEGGTIFRCAYVESFVRAVGTAEDSYSASDVTVQATLPWNQRLEALDFLWRIRDTGTDREWTDQQQPSLFLGGGYMGPLWLPRRTILGGGTVIFVQLDPFFSDSAPGLGTFFEGGTVSQYIVQVSFVGHEMPDESAL